MEGWQKLLLAAGGAAGVAAVLYYLLRDETEAESKANEDSEVAAAVAKKQSGEFSREDVLMLLEEIVGMQTSMKANMKELTKEIAASGLEFEQIYARCKEVQPTDPCEKRGLKPQDLDQVLMSYSNDPEVAQAITKIMGDPEPQAPSTKPLKDITLDTLVDVHVFMLQELKSFVSNFEAIPDKTKYDMKTVAIATQATLDAKVTKKFSITSEDMEGAIPEHKDKLMQNMKFLMTHQEFQRVMQEFLGASMGQ